MKIGELLENLSLPEYRHVAVRRETSTRMRRGWRCTCSIMPTPCRPRP